MTVFGWVVLGLKIYSIFGLIAAVGYHRQIYMDAKFDNEDPFHLFKFDDDYILSVFFVLFITLFLIVTWPALFCLLISFEVADEYGYDTN